MNKNITKLLFLLCMYMNCEAINSLSAEASRKPITQVPATSHKLHPVIQDTLTLHAPVFVFT